MTSREVQDAVGEAPARTKGNDATSTKQSGLQQRAAELRGIVEKPSEKELAAAELANVERQIADAREAEATQAAENRLLGLRRAVGSVAASMDGDEKRVREKIAELAEAVTRLNDRHGQVSHLKAEAAALCDRFGLASPTFPKVVPPALRGLDVTPSVGLAGIAQVRVKVERCEHGLRERRNYEEVRGTEGYQIIESAGLTPFPDLTQGQRRVIEARGREHAATQRQSASLTETLESVTRAFGAAPSRTGIGAL